MRRREVREHIFRILFRAEFHTSEQMAEQGQLYANLNLTDPDEIQESLDEEARKAETAKNGGSPEGSERIRKSPDYVLGAAQPTQEEISYILDKTGRIVSCLDELDARINEITTGWKTSRMSKVDLTILRLAFYEILYDDEIPTKVAINEAVELAKKYGTQDSSSFVNGILAKLAKKLE